MIHHQWSLEGFYEPHSGYCTELIRVSTHACTKESRRTRIGIVSEGNRRTLKKSGYTVRSQECAATVNQYTKSRETERGIMQKRSDAGGWWVVSQAQAARSFFSLSLSHRRRPTATETHVPKSDFFQVKGILNYTGGGHSHTKNVLFCGEVVWCRDSIYLH